MKLLLPFKLDEFLAFGHVVFSRGEELTRSYNLAHLPLMFLALIWKGDDRLCSIFLVTLAEEFAWVWFDDELACFFSEPVFVGLVNQELELV